MTHSIAGFNLPHASSDDPLQRILTAALPERRGPVAPGNYWDADFFQLFQVPLFQSAPPVEQAAILQLANRGLLTEAYAIEQAGVGYMAKMVLLADCLEERSLYGLFTADETIHLNLLTPFLPEPAPAVADPFLGLLAEVVETADKTVLLFVIQVVLEGWGLSHYRHLARGCQHPGLAALLTSFVQAEARHHGTGATLFNQRAVTPANRAAIVEVLATFLKMVQVGPQRLLAEIEQVRGHLSRGQKIQILTELDTLTHSGSRLHLLRSLMRGETAGAIVQALEDRGMFQPLPAEQCV